tara:strand:+ start:5886 stop:6038 length:153 start_codon:yes stop_codon:yes gene_type:complete
MGKNNPKNEIGQNKLGLIKGEIIEESKLIIIKELKKKIVFFNKFFIFYFP